MKTLCSSDVKPPLFCVACGEPFELASEEDDWCWTNVPANARLELVDEQQVAKWEEDGQLREAVYEDGWVRVPFQPTECRKCTSRIDKVRAVDLTLRMWWVHKTHCWSNVTGWLLENPAWISFWAEMEKQFGRIAQEMDIWNEIDVQHQQEAWRRFQARMDGLGFSWEQTLRMRLGEVVAILRKTRAPTTRHITELDSKICRLEAQLNGVSSQIVQSAGSPSGANGANISGLFPKGRLQDRELEGLALDLETERAKLPWEKRSDNEVARQITKETIDKFPRAKSLLSRLYRLRRQGLVNL